WTGSAWEAVGGAALVVPGLGSSTGFAMSVDASAHPVVAFQDKDNKVIVSRWTGTVWEPLGSALGKEPGPPLTIALDGSGEPVLAYSDRPDGVSYTIVVRQWTGADWQSLTGLNPFLGEMPAYPSLAVNRSGWPIVAFQEWGGTAFNVYVEQWAIAIHHLEWQPVGSAINAAPPHSASQAALVLDEDDNPVVVFIEDNATANDVNVQRWNGSSWEVVGGSLNPFGNRIGSPCLVLDGSDRPVIAFHESDGSRSKVFVFRLNR